jgi:RNA polymerase-interacting CarD/CdnL/TRCF family regulator
MANQGAEITIGDGSLHVGDRVVYPNQGICRITGVEVKQIAGQSWEVVTLSREEDGATVMVPRTKVMGIGLRKVANVDAIEEVFDYLASPSDDPQLDWKVRHRENADKMTGGGLFGTAEVLKGLHALSRVRPLPQKERELYDSARHLIVGEIAAAMGIPIAVAENNLDYALFPPPGMTRKGKELVPAAIPATAGPVARRGGDDEDLGFDDEAAEDEGEAAAEGTAAKPAHGGKAKGAGEGADEDLDGLDADEELAPVKPAAKAPKGAKAAAKAAPAKPEVTAKAPSAPAAAAKHPPAHAAAKPAPAAAKAATAQARPAAPAKTAHAKAPATKAHPAKPAAPAKKASEKKADKKPAARTVRPAAKAPPAKKAAKPAAKAKGKR